MDSELQEEKGKNVVRLEEILLTKLQGAAPGRMPKCVRGSFGWCNGHCT